MSVAWDVAGIGNSLVDALVIVENDEILAELGLVRGTMHPVDHERWMHAYERLRRYKVVFESGGSCANTVSTVGLLGGRAICCGQVGDDQMGHMYAKKLEEACGSHAMHFTSERATGKCLSIISAVDAERTMLTDLGAATELPAIGETFERALASTKVAHFTGYELLGGKMRDTVLDAMRVAKEHGARISFDAADPFVIRAIRDQVWQVLIDFADVVFLNAEEARALTDDEPRPAIETIARKANLSTVAVKLGGRGSLVWQAGELHEVGINRVHAVDTTGAGDAYAGGFLYGLPRGWPAIECGRLAAGVAALTVSQVGAVVKDRAALRAVLEEHAPTGSSA
jgi:sugar/nucleoside kinase (ribokinase family)